MSILDSIKSLFVKTESLVEDKFQENDILPDGVYKFIGIGTNRYHPDPNYSPDDSYEIIPFDIEENPRPEEDMAEWFRDRKEKPDESDEIEEEKTMHQKMYEMATQKHSPWKGGGSENFQGGSEERLEEFTPENDPYGGY